MSPGPRAPTTRPSRKTTARWYSRRTLSPLSTNAAKMAIAAHAPSIAASLQRLSRRARRSRQDADQVLYVALRRSLPARVLPRFPKLADAYDRGGDVMPALDAPCRDHAPGSQSLGMQQRV